MGLFDFLKPKSKPEYILNKYYKGYLRKPYISPDRDFDKWEEMVATFPKMLVQEKMMIPYEDGLLPGHVYMLYWIDKVHRSRIPDYFEYEYGIDFETEKHFLNQSGYLSNNSITEKGQQAIQLHYEVILKRNPEPTNKAPSQIAVEYHSGRIISERKADSIEEIPKEEYSYLESELKYLNKIVAEVSRNFSLPKMTISFDRLRFGMGFFDTHYIFTPYTKAGRSSKYPLSIRYSYPERDNGTPAVFGNIYYLQNGSIGKTSQIYWIQKEGYVIDFGLTKDRLVLKRIEHLTPLEGARTFIYKESAAKK